MVQLVEVRGNQYKVVNGLFFDIRTPDAVCNTLAVYYGRGVRVRVFLGDQKTGKCWLEFYDVIGYIGRSCGEVKSPLLIAKSNSSGGPAILTHCIIRITVDCKDVYRHPKFHIGKENIVLTADLESRKKGLTHEVLIDNELVYRCKSLEQAQHVIAFLKGERNRV